MKVRHKLLAALVASSLLTSILIGIGAFQIIGTVVQERFLERIRAESGLLAFWLGSLDSSQDVHDVAVSAGSRLGYRVTFVLTDGTVVGDSAQDRPGLLAMDNHAGRPEIVQAMREGSGESRRTSRTTGVTYYYRALRVSTPSGVSIVRVALPVSEVRRARARYVWIGGLVALAALLVLSIAAYGAVRRLSKPVEQMTEAAERAAGGDLRTGLCLGGDDEIGRLCSAVDRMRLSMIQEIDDLEAERLLLSSVVAGIRDGLLLVDGELRVGMANDGFREIFGVTIDPLGRLLAEVVRNPQIIGFLETSVGEGREIRDQVVHMPESGQAFELHVTPLRDNPEDAPRGALALFFDITRLEALENVRQEFVANVSHELRTPLTSIRAFVETLLDGGLDDRENRERFLGIVQRHAGHMAELIDDLTDLSRIETGAVTLEPSEVGVLEIARDAVEQVEARHLDSDIQVNMDIPGGFTVPADRLRLAQILVNLVDNAVKFNRPGGKVDISGEAAGDRLLIRVQDTGTGIPSESLERIFNRFYRVDKARSKDVPGTGLGLSIVKHLMRLHGGTVRVESEYGQGATFTLVFPARKGLSVLP